MRTVIALLLSAFCSAAAAGETTLDCVTKDVFRRDGAPPVMIATFDGQLGSATLFAAELGGLLKGQDVRVDPDMVMFRIKTKAGDDGDATIMRTTGELMLNVATRPGIRLLANCSKRSAKF